MNPHFVLNFNLSSEAGRAGADAGTADVADEGLPTPFTAGAAASGAGDATARLPSPLDAAGAAVQASADEADLPTPLDLGGAGSTESVAADLPMPLQSAQLQAGADSGGRLPTPHERPA